MMGSSKFPQQIRMQDLVLSVFFMYVINFIILANKFNLLPFVHFERNLLGPVIHKNYWDLHDKKIHLNLSSFSHMNCISSENFEIVEERNNDLINNYMIYEYGLWNDYFEPLSIYSGNLLQDCPVSLVVLSDKCSIIDNIHFHPSSIKAWNYCGSANCKLDRPYDDEGIFQMRLKASLVVRKYFKPLDKYLIQPTRFQQQIRKNSKNTIVLGIHLRGTDKGDGRKRTHVSEYLTYTEAFLTALPAGIGKIFVATDDTRLLLYLKNNLSQKNFTDLYSFDDFLRSDSNDATFRKFDNLTAVNQQVLQDILMLSACDYFIHGESAVSESAIYMNFKLHYRSINVDSEDKIKGSSKLKNMVMRHWKTTYRGKPMKALESFNFTQLLPNNVLENDLVRAGRAVYVIQNGKKCLINSVSVFYAHGWDFDSVKVISWDDLETIPDGEKVVS